MLCNAHVGVAVSIVNDGKAIGLCASYFPSSPPPAPGDDDGGHAGPGPRHEGGGRHPRGWLQGPSDTRPRGHTTTR